MVLGGTSGERAVSLDSGKACVKALKKKRYKVLTFDPKFKNLNLINKQKIDVIFNALHGKDGEDGIAQSYFEYLKIPYTHSGVLSSYNSMNKLISKEIFTKNKILTPKFLPLNRLEYKDTDLKRLLKKKKIYFPLVIKPISEGSSLGVKIIKNFADLKKSSKNLHKTYDQLLIEEYVGGQEIQVAVINKSPLGAIELIPKRKFYDYKAKYLSSAKTIHVIPPKISKILGHKIKKIALKAHKVLKCKGVTRSDFRVTKNGLIYILETNTQPGMTKLSLVPEIAMKHGMNFKKLVSWMIKDASIKR